MFATSRKILVINIVAVNAWICGLMQERTNGLMITVVTKTTTANVKMRLD